MLAIFIAQYIAQQYIDLYPCRKGSAALKQLKMDYGIQVKTTKSDQFEKITIEGPPEGVKLARSQVEVLVKKIADEARDENNSIISSRISTKHVFVRVRNFELLGQGHLANNLANFELANPMSWRTSSRIWRMLILISRNLFKFGERRSYLTLKF